MKGSRQVVALVALLAPLVLSLAACSSASGPATEPVTITSVVVSLPWLPDHSAEGQRLAEAFHEANPQIGVQVVTISIEELSQGLADADLFTNPEWGVDVIMTSVEFLVQLAQAGLLRDLQPSLDAGRFLQGGDFFAAALEALRWQGHFYGLPVEVDPWVMFYNQDLFDAASIPYPSGDWRWDDFVKVARTLAASPAVRFAFGSWGAQVTAFIYQNEGSIVDDPVVPTMATLDRPATVEAVRWYVNLALVEGVMPTPADLAAYATGVGRQQTIVMAGDEASKAASQAQADLEQAIADGEVGMWLGRLSDRGGRWQRWAFRWGIGPLPAGRKAATLASLQACFVTVHAEHFDQALRWADYVTRHPPLHRGLPAHRAAAATDVVQAQLDSKVEEVLGDLLAGLEEWLLLPESLDGQAARWLQGPLFAVLEGQQTVEGALEAAQQQAERALGHGP